MALSYICCCCGRCKRRHTLQQTSASNLTTGRPPLRKQFLLPHIHRFTVKF